MTKPRNADGYERLVGKDVLAGILPMFRDQLVAGLQGASPVFGDEASSRGTVRAPAARLPETPSERSVRDALEGEAEEARAVNAVGLMARLLVQVTMPHAKTEVRSYERRNGNVSIAMSASREGVGLPYGPYPRLIMAWITTEAARIRSPDLELGDSLAGFMKALGLSSMTGGAKGTIRALKSHLQRLFCSTVSWTNTTRHGEQGINVHPVEAYQLWWDPKMPKQAALWRSTLSLNRRFYDEIVNRPVPVDMRALKELARSRSPLAIDIYMWLTYRMSYLRRDAVIPWEVLALQFGGGYAETRMFKFKFGKWLRRVLELYPEAQATVADRGLLLSPSPTHVPKLPS